MIISASRRTDIPAFFSEEFFGDLGRGYKDVGRIKGGESRVSLKREDVDCFVFWTKNPGKMMEKIDLLEGYIYYFQFTVNPYGEKMEPGTYDKKKILKTFKDLSKRIGKERVIWRYDPVILGDKNDIKWHIEEFGKISGELKGYTDRAVFSFYDEYGKLERRMREFNVKSFLKGDMEAVAEGFAEVSSGSGMELRTCAEQIDLTRYGIRRGKCVDDDLIRKLKGGEGEFSSGCLRDFCGCVKSVDIGDYGTCGHGCRYCYAC